MSETKPRYWISAVPGQCDYSSNEIATEFVDGVLPGSSRWGCFRPDVFLAKGGKLGTGLGQHYRRQADGRFMKVAG